MAITMRMDWCHAKGCAPWERLCIIRKDGSQEKRYVPWGKSSPWERRCALRKTMHHVGHALSLLPPGPIVSFPEWTERRMKTSIFNLHVNTTTTQTPHTTPHKHTQTQTPSALHTPHWCTHTPHIHKHTIHTHIHKHIWTQVFMVYFFGVFEKLCECLNGRQTTKSEKEKASEPLTSQARVLSTSKQEFLR